MRFLNKDTGGASGAQASQQAGGVVKQEAAVQDPFEGIDLDDLDPQARKVIEDAKGKFATLQKDVEETKRIATATEKQAREWQGRYDRIQADFKKAANGGAEPAEDKKDALIKQLEQQMIGQGMTPEVAKSQAPLMAGILEVHGQNLKQEIGRDLAPMGQSVMMREAEHAWNQAMAQDKLGALRDPAIAGKVWEGVTSLVNSGQPVSPGVVLNLRNMIYAEHLENNGGTPPNPQMHQQPPPPSYPSFGGSYPGAGAMPHFPTAPDPNAPRTQLNEDTRAALAATFNRFPIKPKAFGGK